MAEALNTNPVSKQLNAMSFLSGGGEMGELTRSYNWNSSSLGPVEQWPQSLRTTVSMILSCKFPMFLWWGDDMIQFYNDGYRPSLGNEGKHPKALGQKAVDCWQEIWPVIYPLIEQVRTTGLPTWSEDQLIPIYRNGQMEDVYWTFGYSAIRAESGKVEGILVVCTETTEKVINLKRLEESNDQLQFAIEAAELGTWDLDVVANTFTGNNRMKEWFGLAYDEEVDLALAIEVMAEEDRERVSKAIAEALTFESGGHYDIVYTIIHPVTHIKRIVRAKGRAWFDSECKPYRFNGTLEDITEEATIKKELAESKQNLEMAIETGELGVYQVDLVKDTTQYSQRIMDWFGFTGQGAPMKERMKALLEEDRPVLNNIIQRAIAGENSGKYDHIYRMKSPVSGQIRYMRSKGQVHFKDGSAVGITGILQDVTEQALVRQKIEESESRFRQLSESNIIGIVFWDYEGRLKEANHAFLEMIEYSEEEFRSGRLNWIDLTPPELLAKDVEIITKLKEDRKTRLWEKQYITKSGKRVDVMIGVALLDGKEDEGIAFIMDITDRKQAARRLELTNSTLVRINTDLDNFIYTASHDLNAPIANLEGLLEALMDDYQFDDVQQDILNMMNESIQRFKITLKDLTDVSKVQRMDQEDLQMLSFSKTLNEVQLDIRGLIQAFDPLIVTQFEVDEINFSRKHLRSILYNLLSNALKYSAPQRRPEVYLSTREEAGFIILTVRDNGMGVQKEDHAKIFEMFERVHDHVEGTGVGLYMIKRMIENAGGRIEIESKVNQGSTFTVFFNIHS